MGAILATRDIAGPGHNLNLKDPLEAEVDAVLAIFKSDFDERGGEIERCRVTTEDEAGRATALAGILFDIADAAEKKRVEIKAPYLKAGKVVDTRFATFIDRVKIEKERIRLMIQVYGDEQKRKAHEEAARLAHEAAEKDAAAKAAAEQGNLVQAARLQKQAEAMVDSAVEISNLAPQPIRSAYGQTASARTEWKFTVTDRKDLPASILNHPKVIEAQDIVIGALVRGGTRQIPGVKIYSESKTVIRR